LPNKDEGYSSRLRRLKAESDMAECWDDKPDTWQNIEEIKDRAAAELRLLQLTLGDFCAAIKVVFNGVTRYEQEGNIRLFAEIADMLGDGDLVTFDVTHSFRSLPFYELLTIYLAKISRNIKIEKVTYGMIDVRHAYCEATPIVELELITELLEWSHAAHEFEKFGSTMQLSELLSAETAITRRTRSVLGQEFDRAIRLFENPLATEDTKLFQQLVNLCFSVSGKIREDPMLRPLSGIMDEITKHFAEYRHDIFALQFAFALWQMQKTQYLFGAITIVECVINLSLDLLGETRSNTSSQFSETRLAINNLGNSLNSVLSCFYRKYRDTKRLRDDLAHNLNHTSVDKKLTLDNAKAILTMYLNNFAPGKGLRIEFRKALLSGNEQKSTSSVAPDPVAVPVADPSPTPTATDAAKTGAAIAKDNNAEPKRGDEYNGKIIGIDKSGNYFVSISKFPKRAFLGQADVIGKIEVSQEIDIFLKHFDNKRDNWIVTMKKPM
jgi:CRISPR-associated DxTHG motif protein